MIKGFDYFRKRVRKLPRGTPVKVQDKHERLGILNTSPCGRGSNPLGPTTDSYSVKLKKRDGSTQTKSIAELPKHHLYKLMKQVSQTRKQKYHRNKDPKYGNINKGFTEAELQRFLKVCKNKKALLAFQLMAYLGLRVGEVVELKADDINFHQNTIRVTTEKAHTGDLLYLHQGVRILLLKWVRMHPEKIHQKGNYILFSGLAHRQHISEVWLRKKFRIYCKAVDLNEWYCYSTKEKKLHRLTTHSLRHYYITRVYKHSKNPLHTQRLARHKSFKATQGYINMQQEDIDKTLRHVFESKGLHGQDVDEFIEFYQLWKKAKSK